jgi:hypothetical protein
MTEHKQQSMFMNLVEKTFDEIEARGYSYQRSRFSVLKLRLHICREAATIGSAGSSKPRNSAWTMFQPSYGLVGGFGLDTTGSPPRT